MVINGTAAPPAAPPTACAVSTGALINPKLAIVIKNAKERKRMPILCLFAGITPVLAEKFMVISKK
jgi:hypothetical protein